MKIKKLTKKLFSWEGTRKSLGGIRKSMVRDWGIGYGRRKHKG